MKKILAFAVLVAGFATAALAANSTVSYTAGQSNIIRSKMIPRYNQEHCAKFGQGIGCTSADLVAGGCSPVTVQTITIDSCVVFTSDAAGEQAFIQEMSNIMLLSVYNRQLKFENDTFQAAQCAVWKSSNQTQRDSICAANNQPAGCAGPCQ